VFDEVPEAGSWATALLLDGSVGIGGAPLRLLRRVRALLDAGGRVLVETAPPGVRTRAVQARLEARDGVSPAFPWATVGAHAVAGLGRAAGFPRAQHWSHDERWFAELT
jgi:hypothetical protein